MQANPAVARHASTPREQRFEALYAEHHGHVFGYVMRRCDRPDDAADAIAETFLVAWRRLDDAPAGDAQRLWLYAVARRVLANQRRGEHRRLALSQRLRSELTVRLSTAPATHPELLDQREALRGAFQTLSTRDRELLALEAWEELSSRQIAKVLGCSSAAARTRLHRARRRLQQAIDAAAQPHAQALRPQPHHDTDRPEAIGGGI